MRRQLRQYARPAVPLGIVLALLVVVGLPYVRRSWHRLVDSQLTTKQDYHGIDVSKHQGRIDWPTVAQDRNVQFVYIKATEGATLVDKRYEENIKQSAAVRTRTAYHGQQAHFTPARANSPDVPQRHRGQRSRYKLRWPLWRCGGNGGHPSQIRPTLRRIS